MRYTFPAVFTEEPQGISIFFPDLPGCLPCADDFDEAFKNAKEALHLHLKGMKQDGELIPPPTKLRAIPLDTGQALALIDTQL